MADLVTCTNKIELSTIILSLWSNIQSIAGTETAENGFRITQSSGESTTSRPVDCDNKADFEELFRRAIVVADDGYPALRTIITDYANGSGLTIYPGCKKNYTTWQQVARMAFVIDSNGDVCFNIVNIT